MPWSSIFEISPRIGTENPQVGMLQLATVSPHPHWQVRPCATSSTMVDANAGAAINSASAMNTAPAEKRIIVLLATGRGFRGDLFLAATERLGDRRALAHIGPHRDDGAEEDR